MRGRLFLTVVCLVLLAVVLQLSAALAQGPPPPPPGAPPPPPAAMRSNMVYGEVKAVDAAAGTLTVMGPGMPGAEPAPKTLVVDAQTEITKQEMVPADQLKVGDTISVREMRVMAVGSGVMPFSATGRVTDLKPLSLKVSDAIMVTITDAKALMITRQAMLKVGDVKVGDSVLARVEGEGDRVTAKSITVNSRSMMMPRMPAGPPPAPPAPPR